MHWANWLFESYSQKWVEDLGQILRLTLKCDVCLVTFVVAAIVLWFKAGIPDFRWSVWSLNMIFDVVFVR